MFQKTVVLLSLQRNSRKERVDRYVHAGRTVYFFLNFKTLFFFIKKKKQKTKQDWGCSSVMKYLPSMHKALGTISSTSEYTRERTHV